MKKLEDAMSSQLNSRKSVFWGVTTLVFVLACSVVLGPTTSAPPAPAFDPTRAALELQATAMAMQLTQAAMNVPVPPAQPPPAVPQVVPTQPQQVLPTPTQDLMARMKTAKILVYENTDERNIGMWVSDALDNLGLTYTNTGSYSGHFMEYLNSGTIYDLIIVDAEDKDKISGEFWDVINTRLTRDKAALIVEIWYLDREANGPINKIMSRCGIAYQADWDFAESIYWWEPTHPIFNEPNTVLPLIHYSMFWTYGHGQAGDKIRLGGSGDAVLLAGLSATSQSRSALLATCMEGRVIFQTFSDHDYHEADIIPLWENYIYNTLKAHFAVTP
jgi:hypothetical protein